MNTPVKETKTKDPSRLIPKGPSWQTLTALTAVAIVAIVVGVTLAKPIRTGVSKLSHVLDRQADSHAGHDETANQYYTCGMHPWVILPAPGDCPICHMKLVPLDVSKFTGEIGIDPAITQRIGVRTTPALLGMAYRDIQTTGSVAWDESTLHDITLKYAGWVEKLHVDTIGQPVKKGQLLFEVYAPAVYVAQEEYLTALRQQKASQTASSDRFVESAKRRLEFLDLTPEQIEALEKRGHSQKTIGVYSPADGYIVERNITLGASIQVNEQLYRIADISKVWVIAAIYEQQLPLVHKDMQATMTLSYQPGKVYQGKVAYVYPYLDNNTRQASARLVFDNPDHLLKPGMFAQVNMQVQLPGERLLIPRNAVINTGKRHIAFVSPKKGHFEPRTITLGSNVQDGQVEVLEGIAPNENVVVQGQFLLDSESNMRQTLSKMMGNDKPQNKQAEQANLLLSEQNANTLNALIDSYLVMSDKLAASENDLAKEAKKFGDLAQALATQPVPGRADFWRHDSDAAQSIKQITDAVQSLQQPHSLPQTRVLFLKLSDASLKLLKQTGVPANRKTPVEQIECDMYKHGSDGQKLPVGGVWITHKGQVRNPYFGSMMLGCFTGQENLPVGQIQSDANSSTHNHEAHE